MKLRPFSDHDRGMFVSVDGPSGAGKSTIVHHLAQLLVAAGEQVHVTAEPSTGPIGQLCRELTETVTGHALACLYAADRYHHVETEVRKHTEAGKTVISDRYLSPASSHAEAHFYRQATDRLVQAGFDVLRVDCNGQPPEKLAGVIRERLTTFFAAPRQ